MNKTFDMFVSQGHETCVVLLRLKHQFQSTFELRHCRCELTSVLVTKHQHDYVPYTTSSLSTLMSFRSRIVDFDKGPSILIRYKSHIRTICRH